MLIMVPVLAGELILSISDGPGTAPGLGVGLRPDTGLRPSLFLRPADSPFLVLVLIFALDPDLFPCPVADLRPNADPAPCTRPGADSLN